MEQLEITVKTLDGNDIPITLHASDIVEDLKYSIQERAGIPIDRQRLLYNGRNLKDEASLSSIFLTQTPTVYLVGSVSREDDPLLHLAQLSLANNAFRRARRRIWRVNEREHTEAIYQNLQVIEEFLRLRNPEGFDLNRRELRPGQWVDVKDTVDQWLEAQVIRVRRIGNFKEAFIHYNGWPERWDEWIPFNSTRIQPLRTYTVQSSSAPVLSPLPSIAPTQRSEREFDRFEIILHACLVIEKLKEMMDQFHYMNLYISSCQQLRNRYNAEADGLIQDSVFEKSQALRTQLLPILDRTGRLLSDLGSLIGLGSNLQVPAMQPGSEESQLGSGIDLYIHTLFLPM